MFLKTFLFLAILAISLKQSVSQKKLVCYYTNWSQYRVDQGRFLPEDIDPQLCTHIIYGFAKINIDHIEPFEWNDETSGTAKGMFRRVTDLKALNPNLKVVLAVGGWTFGSTTFSQMVANPALRSRFITTSISYLKNYGFDGLDLDWEFPGYGIGSTPYDKYFFSFLCEEAKLAYTANGLSLSAAVPVNPLQVEAGYEIDRIAKSLDWISLMTYNYHGTWDTYTGFNAPLYPRTTEVGQDRNFNVDYAVNYWLGKGFPKEKLLVGLSTYGRSFKLNQPFRSQPGDAAYAGGTAGPYTKETGFLSYYEVCQKISQGWTRSWNTESHVPYADNGYEWIGFDDAQSFKDKIDYVKVKNLGGAMVWSLDLDDFSGKFCGQGKYPLINTIKNALNGNANTITDITTTCALNYKVAGGDYCYSIWTRNGIDEATFYKLNPTVNCAALQVGQSLCVKSSASSSSTATTCPSVYKVASGDTCYNIYTANRMTDAQFYSINPNINCGLLQIGQAVNVLKAC